ncbi:MAG: hypothetical protein ACKOAH_23090, partial [Pirellula sp.]
LLDRHCHRPRTSDCSHWIIFRRSMVNQLPVALDTLESRPSRFTRRVAWSYRNSWHEQHGRLYRCGR